MTLFWRKNFHSLFLFCFAAIMLCGVYGDVLYALHLGSFFSNATAFREQMISEFGTLGYVSAFLAQFFINPVASGLVLSALMCGVIHTICKGFKFSDHWEWTASVPVILCVLLICGAGYHIHLRIADLITTPTLGLLYTFGCGYFASRDYKQSWINIAINALFTIVGVAICGIYGTSVALVVAIAMFTKTFRQEKTDIPSALKITLPHIIIFFIVLFCASTHYDGVRYLTSPMCSTNIGWLGYVQIMSVVSGIILISLFGYRKSETTETKNKWIPYAGIVCVCLSILPFCEWNENHFASCRMERRLAERDFKGMLTTANDVESPNFMIYAYRLIALDQTNTLEKDLYNYTYKRDSFPAPFLWHYPNLFLFAGMHNDALAYSMDCHLQTGYSYRVIQTMIACYAIGGDAITATRLLNMMEGNIAYADYLKKARKAVNSRESFLSAFPEYKKAMRAEFPADIRCVQFPFEFTYYRTRAITGANISRRLLDDLFTKRMDYFADDIMKLNAPKGVRLSDCFQEAICICSMLGDDRPIKKFAVSKNIGEKLNNIASMIKKGATPDEIVEKYGNNYYTYFYFADYLNRDDTNWKRK